MLILTHIRKLVKVRASLARLKKQEARLAKLVAVALGIGRVKVEAPAVVAEAKPKQHRRRSKLTHSQKLFAVGAAMKEGLTTRAIADKLGMAWATAANLKKELQAQKK